jgi:IS5 family transposase
MQIRHPDRQIPLFRTGFFDALDPGHELVRASRRIDWKGLHRALLPCYSTIGRSGKPTRLMAGLHFLKLRFGCSDAAAVEELHETSTGSISAALPPSRRPRPRSPPGPVRKRSGKRTEELGETFAALGGSPPGEETCPGSAPASFLRSGAPP